jgi:cytoskeletal protein RodZ
MPTVAETLRAARETQKLTINVLADKTKIRTDHLRAIEEGNYAVFPAPIYLRGTVKNYAAALKLDSAQILADLDLELRHSTRLTERPPLSEPGRKGVLDNVTLVLAKLNWKVGVAGLALVLAVGMGGVILWVLHRHNTQDPLAGLPPAVYRASTAGDTLPLPAHR